MISSSRGLWAMEVAPTAAVDCRPWKEPRPRQPVESCWVSLDRKQVVRRVVFVESQKAEHDTTGVGRPAPPRTKTSFYHLLSTACPTFPTRTFRISQLCWKARSAYRKASWASCKGQRQHTGCFRCLSNPMSEAQPAVRETSRSAHTTPGATRWEASVLRASLSVCGPKPENQSRTKTPPVPHENYQQ